MTITPGQLKRRYPYMFDGPDIGISIPCGWRPIFEKLCQEIDAALGVDKRNFHFTQCKQKFGAARWYWSIQGCIGSIRVNQISEKGETLKSWTSPRTAKTESQRLEQQIDAFVQTATISTQHACSVCGDPGGLTDIEGLIQVLCEQHARESRTRKCMDNWFDVDDQ